MSTPNRDELTRPQLRQVTNLARTLHEASEELYKTATRRHPELEQATWLIRQTLTKLLKILKAWDKEF